jgi:hypothetical protein
VLTDAHDELLPSPAVVPPSTSLVLDAVTGTCLTARTTLRLRVVLAAAADTALLTATMTTVIAPDFPSDNAVFEHCLVKSHEDFPRHIYLLFKVLCIQFRWALTCGTLARALVSSEDLAIDDTKESAWMALYEHDRDTLQDIIYRQLQDLWALLTDAMKVFDTHGSAHQMCAQKVWEALLTSFPLDHKRIRLF